jgi:hypothetical protein
MLYGRAKAQVILLGNLKKARDLFMGEGNCSEE